MRFGIRVLVAVLFMEHGVVKLFGWLGGPQVPFVSLYGLAGVLESFGGLAIAFGALTRPIAALLAAEMFIAYLKVHAGLSPWPMLNQGEPALLYAFAFILLCIEGPGPISLDAAIRNARFRFVATTRKV